MSRKFQNKSGSYLCYFDLFADLVSQMNCKFQNKSGLYLGYFDFFSNLVSELEFKKSPVQVYIKPNLKLIESFKTNLGCIWVIPIFYLNRFSN